MKNTLVDVTSVANVSDVPIFNAEYIQGKLVSTTTPNDGEVLAYSDSLGLYVPTPNGAEEFTDPIAIGTGAGTTSQGLGSVAIGVNAGTTSQKIDSIAIGSNAGQTSQGYLAGLGVAGSAIAIGTNAGQTSQETNAVAIGSNAGNTSQQKDAIAIGFSAGETGQSSQAIAIGKNAGQSNQGKQAIAIGSGTTPDDIPALGDQGDFAIAIGSGAGSTNQGTYSVAIGYHAGNDGQGANSIAIGHNATNITENSISIGYDAISVASNSIMLNASGSTTSASTSSLYVRPVIGEDLGINAPVGVERYLAYNPDTYEVTYNSNDGKTFVIQHPLDENKYLVHACLEGPETGVYYRGKGEVVNGVSTIKLPTYTEKFYDFTIQVTPIYNGTLRLLNCSRILNGEFNVYGNDGLFDWHVTGKRGDIVVEQSKDEVELCGNGPYLFLKKIEKDENCISINSKCKQSTCKNLFQKISQIFKTK